MSGYHKSKEVYKYHRDVHGNITIIHVRGLYISGTHLEPAYWDHNVTITGISSTDGVTVVDYVNTTKSTYDYSGIRFIDCTWQHPLTVVDYTSSTHYMYDYSGIRFIDCAWQHPITVTSYTSSTHYMYDYSGIRFIDCTWQHPITISDPSTPVPNKYIDGYDHNVTITSIVSGPGPDITSPS